ncbi:MAG TPA: gamma-glutamyl-gamma-aminobutyrate hydrolase family protein [Euzebyales bacterium]|nr:gamma-glutamyl-gamma-aminobutyrate hydrolase family protein [Euzebyales bacterium]
MPVVGISATSGDVDGQFGTLSTAMVSELYIEAVDRAGGASVLLPARDPTTIPALLDRLDAVILTGGGDLQPILHRRAEHQSLYGIAAERDLFDVHLAATARDRRVPMLAICRGMQVVNVALGGDLIVDIPSEVGTQVEHRIAGPGVVAGHPIRLEQSSVLAALLGTARIDVNSSHHQAIRTLGRGLIPVAWADDGVVEAVEAVDAAWPCMGVQWHPEYHSPDNAAARRPFEALVDAARHRTLAR